MTDNVIDLPIESPADENLPKSEKAKNDKPRRVLKSDGELAPNIKVDLSAWRMKDHKRWTETARSGDADAINAMFVEIVKEWPFEGDPATLADYDDLFPGEWVEVLGAVSAEAERLFRREGSRVLSRREV